MAIAQQYDAHIIHAYASLLYDMGAGEDALRYVDEAIAGAPDVPNFWQTKIALTNALFANNPTKIESVYREGIRATKDDVDLLTLYASYLGSHGRPAEAIQYWRQAADKNPKAKDVYESEIEALQ
ncbi:hypothetical protein H6768_04740 [Candidatus Peribacteria bacterium]|nr:hypothetical protein [Candidatus Peribacteria bacterium]